MFTNYYTVYSIHLIKLESSPHTEIYSLVEHQHTTGPQFWEIKNISKFVPQGNFVSYLAANIVRSAAQCSVSINHGPSLLTGALNLHSIINSSEGKSIQILRESESYLEINSASSE